MSYVQRIFSGHLGSVHSVPERAVVNPCSPTPLGKRFSYFSESYTVVRSRIVGLLNRSGPSAVVFDVSEIVIDPIDRVAATRANPHVRKKISKHTPPIANGHPTTLIVGSSSKVLVCASSDHVGPYSECSGPGHSVSFASLRNNFILETSARNGFTCSEIPSVDYLFDSASAPTLPHSLMVDVICGSGDNRPTSKFLTSKVFEFCHSALLNVAHLKEHGKRRCSRVSGATLAMQRGL